MKSVLDTCLVQVALRGVLHLLRTRRRPLRARDPVRVGLPAWKAIMKPCPVVCMTALAISKLLALRRSRISMQTPTRDSTSARFHSLHRGGGGVEQRVDVGCGIAGAQFHSVRGRLAGNRAAGRDVLTGPLRTESSLERFRTIGLRRLSVDLSTGHFRKRRPVPRLAMASSAPSRRWRCVSKNSLAMIRLLVALHARPAAGLEHRWIV